MLRTIIATLAVAATLVALATPSNLGKGLMSASVKSKANVVSLKGVATKVVKRRTAQLATSRRARSQHLATLAL